jgi:hypothetical protein
LPPLVRGGALNDTASLTTWLRIDVPSLLDLSFSTKEAAEIILTENIHGILENDNTGKYSICSARCPEHKYSTNRGMDDLLILTGKLENLASFVCPLTIKNLENRS